VHTLAHQVKSERILTNVSCKERVLSNRNSFDTLSKLTIESDIVLNFLGKEPAVAEEDQNPHAQHGQ
jgi:hypothetical protein